jgi:hypothetical protein
MNAASATWRTLGTLCRELDWSRPRLIDALIHGLRYRTYPRNFAFNWHDPDVRDALDVEASTISHWYASCSSTATADSSWRLNEAIGIEVLPPDAVGDMAAVEAADGMTAAGLVADVAADAAAIETADEMTAYGSVMDAVADMTAIEAPGSVTNAPAPKRSSDAEVARCFRAIKKEREKRGDDPPSEVELLTEMEDRLGAPPGRKRVRELWRTIAPHWKRRAGRPRAQ